MALKRQRIAKGSKADLPELSLRVLDTLKARKRLTISQLELFTGAGRSTLKLRLRELVRSGHVRQHGTTRATWYSPAR